YPGVWARLDSGAAKTILYYSHYDVRPVGPEPWDWPPFGAELTEMPPYKQVIVGRGARGLKGPLQAWLNALQALTAVEGRLPVNVLFLIEGAEILGSRNYLQLAERYREQLREADALFSPGASQSAQGEVSVVLGYKGLLYLELEASGEAWNRGPSAPVHSATNAVVDSPAWRLIHALATLTDREGERLTVDGLGPLFDQRKEISSEEGELLERLHRRFEGRDPNAVIPGLTAGAPVKTFKRGLRGRDVLTEYLYAPSVNISGLRSGYIGPGSKSFLLPHQAVATLDIRLITDLDAQEVLRRLRAHLDREGFGDIRLHAYGAYNWGQTDPRADVVRATLQTLEAHGYPAVVWPMVAFGGPWAHLPRALGIPALRGAGPGYGDRMATSNEFYVIEGDGTVADLADTENFYVDLLSNYAAL
ncbi:MAG TPA: M20/M25/M40 family metallo-hydrolase, partial [Candidatus Methylomirabilis sp.]|nr:M20/M25/M40 family metallo-hydrolase [Candidatus Methylomirabilis sp.]